ncbi:MAG: AzlC family ABC transporter permease [Burkholderiales bacterium]
MSSDARPSRWRLPAQWQRWREDPDFRLGVREMLPQLPGSMAWGLVTGVAMVKVLGVPLAMLMSLVVYSGGAQLGTLPLFASGAPLWLVLLTGLVINLRFVIFSLQWRWYFGGLSPLRRALLGYFAVDQSYVLFMRRYPQAQPGPGQLGYFWGTSLCLCVAWQASTLVGIVFADLVPTHWGLGFIGVLALISLMCTLMTDRASLVSAAVALLAALAAFSLPYKLHIIVAMAAAVAAGLTMEATRAAARPAADATTERDSP